MTTNQHRALAVVAWALALLTIARSGRADTPVMPVPGGCDRGDVVIATGSSTFECVAPKDLLGLRGCDDGEFVGIDSSGAFQCVGASTTPWGIRGLLPDCSSGATLVSEGFGRWKCVDPK
jgi:hypothetical protein